MRTELDGVGRPLGNTRAIVASYAGVLVYSGLVFIGAWKVRYWQGVPYVVLDLVGVTLSHFLVPAGSTITIDRARAAQAGRDWDKRLLGAFFLVNGGISHGRIGLGSVRLEWQRTAQRHRCRHGSHALGAAALCNREASECLLFEHGENSD